jgi:sulfur-oxidizing protein SoxX
MKNTSQKSSSRKVLSLIFGAGLVSLSLAAVSLVHAQGAKPAAVDKAILDKYIATGWTKFPDESWKSRVTQDDTQAICSETRGNPSDAQFKTLLEAEKAKVVFPADGNVIGAWKEGEKVAQNGRGGQFSDEAGTISGGNCYACHQLDPKELSFGNLGPSLLGYGKTKKFAPEEAKAAYAKIYNSMSVLPCSNMPRFGVHKVLTEQQIKDLVGLLFDPASPVNK